MRTVGCGGATVARADGPYRRLFPQLQLSVTPGAGLRGVPHGGGGQGRVCERVHGWGGLESGPPPAKSAPVGFPLTPTGICLPLSTPPFDRPAPTRTPARGGLVPVVPAPYVRRRAAPLRRMQSWTPLLYPQKKRLFCSAGATGTK